MSDSAAQSPSQILSYDGRIGELYRIFLINLLLTIVTLGIWRFWATTRLRRYLWSRTSANGERFEYDGTGGQLFIGFLLSIGLLLGIFLAAFALSAVLQPVNKALSILPIILAELTVVVFVLGAPFSAQRYRLNHTIWRGIRGGMQGSMIKYGLRALLYYFLAVITFYQLLPWAWLRLTERRINASSFGTLAFASRGKPGQLYLRYLATFAAVVLLGAAVTGAFYLLERPLFALMANTPSQAAQQMMIQRLTVPLIVAYLAFGIGATLISASFQAAFYRHVTSHTTLGGMRFSSDVTALDILGLILGNLGIVLVTLGFGLPIVIHRNTRFFAAHLWAAGTLDFGAIGQSAQPVSRFGEGMFQALDAGAGGL